MREIWPDGRRGQIGGGYERGGEMCGGILAGCPDKRRGQIGGMAKLKGG
jgi:hypothetical protein